MIAYVLLNYNTFDMTKICIENIYSKDNSNKKIIIIDNASEDNSGHLLEQEYKNNNDIIVIQLEENLGFARGNNVGYKFARNELNSEYIIIMNNDMEIITNNIGEIINSVYTKEQFDILGPDIYSVKYDYHQNPQRESNYSKKEIRSMKLAYFIKTNMKFLFWIRWNILGNIIQNRNNDKKKSVATGKVENVPLHGSFYVFSKKYIDNNELAFYEGTFMYMESYILHYQSVKKNYKMIYYNKILVNHFEDVSTDKAFNNGYKKAIFTNKCMYESCKAFLKVMD